MKRIAIIGAGDLGQQIAYHATASGEFTVEGFFDDFRKKNEIVHGLPVLGNVSDVLTQYANGLFDELMIGIGYRHMGKRKELFMEFKGTVPFATIIHPAAFVDKSSIVGDGSFILPGCVIDQQVVIGENVMVNVGACIAHDSQIASHTFISPRVAIAGFVHVGSECIIGIQTTVIDNITIADRVQTGGGTVVINAIAQPGLYVGNPARFIR